MREIDDWKVSTVTGARASLSLFASGGSALTEQGGVDLADSVRLAKAVTRSGRAILERAFTEWELATIAGSGSPFFTEAAALFSVKESVVKAVGGLPAGGRLRDIEVGPPVDGTMTRELRLHGEVRDQVAASGHGRLSTGTTAWGERLVLGWAVGVARPA